MPPQLPSELWDAVIDYVDATQSKRALCACSRTCKTWTPRAQFHLFRIFTIALVSHLKLLKFLAETPNIGALVRALTISGRGGHPDAWTDDTMEALLKMMPGVEYVNLDLFTVTPGAATILGRCLPKIELLDLSGVLIEDPATLPTLFTTCPNLQELECGDMHLCGPRRREAFSAPTEATSLPKLTSLGVKTQLPFSPFGQHLVNWMFAHNLHKNLCVLEIAGLDSFQLAPFETLLSEVGPNIEELGVSFVDEPSERVADPRALIPALARCTKLRTLEIMSLTLCHAQPWVVPLLQSISSPHFRRLDVTLRPGSVEHEIFENVDFAGVADVLSRFPDISRVALKVMLVDKTIGPPLQEHILGCLAPLKGRARFWVSLVAPW